MAQVQSFNSNSTTRSFGVFQILRQLGASLLAITVLLVLVGTIIGLSGCTRARSGNDKTASSSTQSNQAPIVANQPVTAPEKPAVTAKKKPAARRARTVAYSSSTYGKDYLGKLPQLAELVERHRLSEIFVAALQLLGDRLLLFNRAFDPVILLGAEP